MGAKRKARHARHPAQPDPVPERLTAKPAVQEVSFFRNPRKVKSTRWQRSYMSICSAAVFLLLAIWYMVSSK